VLRQTDKLSDIERYDVSWGSDRCLSSARAQRSRCPSGTAAAAFGARIVYEEGVSK